MSSTLLKFIANRWCLPVDNSILAYFRILLGVVMAVAYHGMLTRYAGQEITPLEAFVIQPLIHFKYPGFGWVDPLPGQLMSWLVGGLEVLSLCMAAGFCYRIVMPLLCLGNAYYFLCERTLYNNHYYLTALLLFWMSVIPAHRRCSLDVLIRPRIAASTAPAWTVWMLRFHLAMPYAFGAIMKLQGDWLWGEPCGQVAYRIAQEEFGKSLMQIIDQKSLTQILTWGGLLFDLLVVPGLLIARPRWIRWVTCIAVAIFHLSNHFIFNIGIFPWLMLLSTPVFFDPAGPGKLLDKLRPKKLGNAGGLLAAHPTADRSLSPVSDRTGKFISSLLILYIAFHLIFPFRFFLYPGPVNWTEEAEHFSWQMMKREKRTLIQFFVAPSEGVALEAFPIARLGIQHAPAWRMSSNFDMILQTAHFLRDQYRAQGYPKPVVKALSLVSMNGRPPQMLFDPNLNLAEIPRRLGHQSAIRPLEHPLPEKPFLAPTSEWPKMFPIRIEGSTIKVLNKPTS